MTPPTASNDTKRAQRWSNVRADFPLLASNPALHYLDSAATSQKPRRVIDAITGYYENSNANPHRGAYALSARATELYHQSRRTIARFLGVSDSDCLILTRGTTESINLVATSLSRTLGMFTPGDSIVVTALEHHANFVPWQQLALSSGAELRICETDSQSRLDLDHLRSLLDRNTKVVAFGHVSNATGTINPVREMVSLIREHSGAVIVCDGAQSAPHLSVEFDAMGVDFYAFSGHKMLGPMGIGGLIGRRAMLEKMEPYQMGGDMIGLVLDDRSSWNVLPHKFEAGTPNVGDSAGLAAAAEYLGALGMDAVREHELTLLRSAQERLAAIPAVRTYGPEVESRSGVLSFNVDGVHPHDLATILDSRNVCIRAGHHCAQPLMRRLGVSATARASFYVYSTPEDVDALIDGVTAATALFG